VVEWDEKKAGWNITQREIDDYAFELIGNVMEHPELLK